MSKISLRAYNHEIETLIERGHSEEAIAHCKYILKTYSKHLDTYRLLGKAFLESQRYGEAADILTRILSVIPDDFVAQIGMSIIREDEGNLDAAIFHMERSFEIQPSNAAIQDELRRLYGRRDGIEPPKLRLTRGALVRMYARGDLHRQAIAEARAGIKEDPQRLDLEIVLARMFYQTSEKAEAAEICSRLVMKLPYCMEANRILADVLPETSRSDDAKIYQQRLEALEPYLAYQSDPSQNILQIPDNAVTLDRLEWIPSLESAQQPAWANTLGLEIEEKEEEQMPEWLSGLSAEKDKSFTEEDTSQPFAQEQEGFQTPFSVSASETSDTPLQASIDQLPGVNEAGQEAQTELEADMPDWMSGLDETPAGQEEEKLPDWMQGIGETPPSADEEKLPDWMQSSGWEVSEIPTEEQPTSIVYDDTEESKAAPADIPDWLKDFAPASPEEKLPETLISSVEVPAADEILKTPSGANIDEDIPDWLKSPVSSPEENINAHSQEPLPDWLTESRDTIEDLAETPASTENVSEVEQFLTDAQPPVAQFEGDIPAGSLDAAIPTVSEETPSETATDVENMDDAMAWLESLAAKQGAAEETLLTKPEERIETPPQWVSQEADSIETPPADQEEEGFTLETTEIRFVPDESLPQIMSISEEITPQVSSEDLIAAGEVVPATEGEPISSELTDQAEMDSAFAWLESLAAKQGAEPESLLVSSEERLESPPDWIQQESLEIEADVEMKPVETPTEDVEGTSEPLPEWITATDQTETVTVENPAVDESLPDWLLEESIPLENVEDVTLPVMEDITATTEETLPSFEPETASEPGKDWIKAPEMFASNLEETVEQPAVEPTAEVIAEPVKTENPSESDEPEPLPEWLSGELSDSPAAHEEISVTTGELQALPDWLKAETPSTETLTGDADEGEAPPLPDWLRDLESEQEAEPLPIEGGFRMAPVEAQEPGEISQQPDEMILQAQNALSKGQIDFSLSIYQRLIEQEQKLDEIIHDLRDSLYRFPVDSVIWQTLGDAYMRTNQVQEALDAFTKAEELLK